MARAAAAFRYAKALFQLAKAEGRTDAIRAELRQLAQLLQTHEGLRRVVLEPLYPVSERRAVLEEVMEKLGASVLLRHFTLFLVDQRRLLEFDAIDAAYEDLADADAGLTKARVHTASPLSEEQRSRLQRALSRQAGTEVELEIHVDPTLIGGAVAKVGDTVYDGSLRSLLQQLRSVLVKS